MLSKVITISQQKGGSGKTTLGSKIKRVYPYILIKDIDDINRDLPSLYINEYIKTKNKKKFYRKGY